VTLTLVTLVENLDCLGWCLEQGFQDAGDGINVEHLSPVVAWSDTGYHLAWHS
jgi:hypothetical protein